jgi:hypothetical protein
MFTSKGFIVIVGVCLVAIAVSAATKSRETESPNQQPPIPQSSPIQTNPSVARNLSLQPEASILSRKLGKRFSGGRNLSVIDGVLTACGQSQTVRILRRQSTEGEEIEIVLADGRTLTWRQTDGVSAAGAQPALSDRLLIERLVFDSPDQFVLAQLRGASYYTVARSVRPADVGD